MVVMFRTTAACAAASQRFPHASVVCSVPCRTMPITDSNARSESSSWCGQEISGGVVHQRVERAVAPDGLDHLVHLGGISHVAGAGVDGASGGLAQFGFGGRENFITSSADVDCGAQFKKTLGCGLAESGAAAVGDRGCVFFFCRRFFWNMSHRGGTIPIVRSGERADDLWREGKNAFHPLSSRRRAAEDAKPDFALVFSGRAGGRFADSETFVLEMNGIFLKLIPRRGAPGSRTFGPSDHPNHYPPSESARSALQSPLPGILDSPRGFLSTERSKKQGRGFNI